jgi:uncharacterized protein (TIGR03663 family)
MVLQLNSVMNGRANSECKIINAKWLYLGVFTAIIVIALWTRLIQLDARVMHTDEAVHGMFFIGLLEDGVYHFNPTEYHGPTMYYFALPIARLMGQRTGAELTESTLRLLPVLASIAVLLLLALWRPLLGASAVCWAALFTAVSPINLYYSRYYIHEPLLVLFFFGFVTCAMRYWLSRKTGWMLGAGVFAGLAYATKITSILMFSSVGAAWLVTAVYVQLREKRKIAMVLQDIPWRLIGAAGIVAMVVSLLFYSSFLTNLRGVWESITTYFYFANRATGQGHEKPWFTHLQWILWTRSGGFVWSEAFLVALASLGAGLAIRKASRFATMTLLLAVYVLFLMVFYSVIPYKTPWLMLGPMQMIALLAGIGAASCIALPRAIWIKGLLAIGILAGTAQLGRQAQRAAFRFSGDERVPYCYSHASPDALFLAHRIQRAYQLVPAPETPWVLFATEAYWPLPWYLRSIENVGYWQTLPERHDAPILVLDTKQSASIEATLMQTHMASLVGLRPGVLLALWIRNDIWDKVIQ